MNDQLDAFARTELKEQLSRCTPASQKLFKRMYSHDDLEADINDVVDLMPSDRLDWAMQQVSRTSKVNKEKS